MENSQIFHDLSVSTSVSNDSSSSSHSNSSAENQTYEDFEEPVSLEGSVVKDDDEAYELYNSHAFRKGFGTRKDVVVPKSFKKIDRRTGCKASVQFDVDKKTGVYVLSKHCRLHNHSMVPANKKYLIRSYRHISKEQLAFLTTFTCSDTTLADILRAMMKKVCGEAHLGFTVPDAYDALTNFFWRDGRMRSDYEAFGDLLIHDTTYRTNKYDMICGPFVGMNLHTQNIMFGVGFILYKKAGSFDWLFNSFLTSMGGKQTVTIMTDQCSAMDKAIREVFPKSRHQLCMWHIGENAVVNIKGVMAKEGFKRQFDYVLKYSDTVVDFLADYNCAKHSWIIRLYSLKEKWCPAYNKEWFSGGVLSSQRSDRDYKSFYF
ncbi:protein FAR1-RELATED SEQUENCE 5-like [Spinacia oleracea]|uniref:Protein FAR1-RELATED SEQUENCE 5-like n=1 Tax=Spinacia oleracea TaxID=3562 RepID=A0ABM3RQ77_SPIOL|nr:protein FAR1-RELATED SEQUENCE 5-like [Spinacia oleracea]